MKFTLNRLPKSEVEIEVEIEALEFDKFFEEAVLKIAEDVEIQGFRKGKAPKNLVIEKIGEDKIIYEAAEQAVSHFYQKIVKDNNLEPISKPEIQIKKIAKANPLVFKARTHILPEIQLPDYKKIAAKTRIKKASVEEKEIEESIKWLLRSRAKMSQKAEGAQKGDFVDISYSSKDIVELKGNEKKDAFILGEGRLIPGFEDNIAGMKNSEEKEFSINFPDNYHAQALAGKKVGFKVKMNSVQKMEMPEINDEFAKSLGKFENVSALKESVKKGILAEKEKDESQKARNEIIENIMSETKIDIPDILIEREKEALAHDFKHRVEDGLKMSFSDYLLKTKKTEKDIEDSFKEEAEKKVKAFLILNELKKKEKIEASEDEIKEETEKILSHQGNNVDIEKLKEYVKEVISNEKMLLLLENLAIKP